MDQFGIAVWAFDPSMLFRDLQPDAWMPKRTFATITGNAVFSNDPGFRNWRGHWRSHLLSLGIRCISLSDIAQPGAGEKTDMTENAIEIANLRKTYPATRKSEAKVALKGIDLAIPRGSIFGLLGPNGAGKSTLINILAGLVVKTEGAVRIWGFDQDDNPRQSRAAIGVMPQELNLDPFFTPGGSLDVQAGLYGVPKSQRRTDEILDLIGLADKKHAYARSLSGGMRRRLLLGKALVHSPQILVLDEPTAGVDIELRNQLWANVRRLNEEGMTIILTTHYLEEAQEMCDEIAIINHGELIAQDTTTNLLSRIDQKTLAITPVSPAAMPDLPNGITGQVSDAGVLRFTYSAAQTNAEQILDLLRSEGIGIKDVSTEEANLEDVFLALTSG